MAILSEHDVEGLSQDVPVLKVSNAEDALRRFAVSFYNYPSRKMLMVGVTGESQALPNISYSLCKRKFLGMESICLHCQNLWPLAFAEGGNELLHEHKNFVQSFVLLS